MLLVSNGLTGNLRTICFHLLIYKIQIIANRKLSGISQLQSLGQICLPPIFVNKVLLKHRHSHFFTLSLGFFQTTMAELSSYNRNCMVHKLNRLSGPLWKSSPAPSLQYTVRLSGRLNVIINMKMIEVLLLANTDSAYLLSLRYYDKCTCHLT